MTNEAPTTRLRTVDREIVKEVEILALTTSDFTNLEDLPPKLDALFELVQTRRRLVAKVQK